MSLQDLKEESAKIAGLTLSNMEKGLCISCDQAFSDANVHTKAGWTETKISGYCEDCFDSLFEGMEDH